MRASSAICGPAQPDKFRGFSEAAAMANDEDEAAVVLSEAEARAGVTGHHVRYVLAFGPCDGL
jgi:hypothetical protein